MGARRVLGCHAGAGGHVHHVLVVEDDAAIRDILADLLSLEGYAVTASPNGADAIERSRGERPCLALVDLKMPVMDGPTFARSCQRDAALRGMPIVVLSAASETADAEVAGVVGLVTKPFDADVLLQAIGAALRADEREPRAHEPAAA